MRKNFGAKPMCYPMPVYIIGTYGADGTPNAMNAAWGGISEEKEISICVDSGHKTAENLLARGAFTVSMATAEYMTACDYVGIVSGNKDPEKFSKAGFNVLDISLPEEELMSKLLRIQLVSRYEVQHGKTSRLKSSSELSPREKDVLRLMVKGMINKEMAETLGISATTVIFHRNNICQKLQTRSIGKLTIFAVLTAPGVKI